jgi:hypothetical protein
VAGFDCDLNPIRRERVRGERGKTRRKRVEGVLKGEGERELRQGVGPLGKLLCALLVHFEAAAESLLTFFCGT